MLTRSLMIALAAVALGAMAACKVPEVTFTPEEDCADGTCEGDGEGGGTTEACEACGTTDACTDHGFTCGRVSCDPETCTPDTSSCATETMPWSGWDDGHEELDGDTVQIVRVAPDSQLTGSAATNGAANVEGAEITVGDWLFLGGPKKKQDLGAITIDLSGIPPEARIVSAKLRVFQTGVTGTVYDDPMTHVIVDHVRFPDVWASDEATPIPETLAQPELSTSADLGWKHADVTPAVRYELATCSTRAQFRLTFAPANTRGDAADNRALFASDDAASNRPHLVVRFR